MAKKHLTLQHSESVVVQAASQIYAAYIASGQVNDENRKDLIRQSIFDAVKIARSVDDAIVSDGEMD